VARSRTVGYSRGTARSSPGLDPPESAEHDLRDQDLVGIARLSPGKVPPCSLNQRRRRAWKVLSVCRPIVADMGDAPPRLADLASSQPATTSDRPPGSRSRTVRPAAPTQTVRTPDSRHTRVPPDLEEQQTDSETVWITIVVRWISGRPPPRSPALRKLPAQAGRGRLARFHLAAWKLPL